MKIVKKTLKNRDILALFNEFNTNTDKEGLNPYYSLMSFKNAEALLPVVMKINDDLYDERREADWNKFIEKRNEIFQKYADRDEQGNMKINDKNGAPIVTEMIVEFNKAIEELQVEFKDMLGRVQNKETVNANVLSQTTEVEVVTLELTEFPNQAKPFVVGLLTE